MMESDEELTSDDSNTESLERSSNKKINTSDIVTKLVKTEEIEVNKEGSVDGKVKKEEIIVDEKPHEEGWPAQTMIRPKKGSNVKFLMKGYDKVREGKVVKVGKKVL